MTLKQEKEQKAGRAEVPSRNESYSMLTPTERAIFTAMAQHPALQLETRQMILRDLDCHLTGRGNGVDRPKARRPTRVPAVSNGNIRELNDVWIKCFGPALAAHTRPWALRGGTLTLACSGPLKMELEPLADRIIERINSYLGRTAVDRIRLVVRIFPVSRGAGK